MLKIEINKKEYNIPNKWSEMTLEYYCGLYEIIKKYQITEDQENSENDLTKFFILLPFPEIKIAILIFLFPVDFTI